MRLNPIKRALILALCFILTVQFSFAEAIAVASYQSEIAANLRPVRLNDTQLLEAADTYSFVVENLSSPNPLQQYSVAEQAMFIDKIRQDASIDLSVAQSDDEQITVTINNNQALDVMINDLASKYYLDTSHAFYAILKFETDSDTYQSGKIYLSQNETPYSINRDRLPSGDYSVAAELYVDQSSLFIPTGMIEHLSNGDGVKSNVSYGKGCTIIDDPFIYQTAKTTSLNQVDNQPSPVVNQTSSAAVVAGQPKNTTTDAAISFEQGSVVDDYWSTVQALTFDNIWWGYDDYFGIANLSLKLSAADYERLNSNPTLKEQVAFDLLLTDQNNQTLTIKQTGSIRFRKSYGTDAYQAQIDYEMPYLKNGDYQVDIVVNLASYSQLYDRETNNYRSAYQFETGNYRSVVKTENLTVTNGTATLPAAFQTVQLEAYDDYLVSCTLQLDHTLEQKFNSSIALDEPIERYDTSLHVNNKPASIVFYLLDDNGVKHYVQPKWQAVASDEQENPAPNVTEYSFYVDKRFEGQTLQLVCEVPSAVIADFSGVQSGKIIAPLTFESHAETKTATLNKLNNAATQIKKVFYDEWQGQYGAFGLVLSSELQRVMNPPLADNQFDNDTLSYHYQLLGSDGTTVVQSGELQYRGEEQYSEISNKPTLSFTDFPVASGTIKSHHLEPIALESDLPGGDYIVKLIVKQSDTTLHESANQYTYQPKYNYSRALEQLRNSIKDQLERVDLTQNGVTIAGTLDQTSYQLLTRQYDKDKLDTTLQWQFLIYDKSNRLLKTVDSGITGYDVYQGDPVNVQISAIDPASAEAGYRYTLNLDNFALTQDSLTVKSFMSCRGGYDQVSQVSRIGQRDNYDLIKDVNYQIITPTYTSSDQIVIKTGLSYDRDLMRHIKTQHNRDGNITIYTILYDQAGQVIKQVASNARYEYRLKVEGAYRYFNNNGFSYADITDQKCSQHIILTPAECQRVANVAYKVFYSDAQHYEQLYQSALPLTSDYNVALSLKSAAFEKTLVKNDETVNLNVIVNNSGSSAVTAALKGKYLSLVVLNQADRVIAEKPVEIAALAEDTLSIAVRCSAQNQAYRVQLVALQLDKNPLVVAETLAETAVPAPTVAEATFTLAQPTKSIYGKTESLTLTLQSNEHWQDNFDVKVRAMYPTFWGSWAVTAGQAVDLQPTGNPYEYSATIDYDHSGLNNQLIRYQIEAVGLNGAPDYNEWQNERHRVYYEAEFFVDLEPVYAKVGQAAKATLEINHRAASEVTDTYNIITPADMPAEIAAQLNDVTVSAAGRFEQTVTLNSDQVAEFNYPITVKSAEYGTAKTVNMNVSFEPLSKLKALLDKSFLVSPVGIANQVTLSLENECHLDDRVTLEYIADGVTVDGPTELSLSGQRTTPADLTLTALTEGKHDIVVQMTSQNDPSKVYTQLIKLNTRDLIEDKINVLYSQRNVRLIAGETENVQLAISNIGDNTIDSIAVDVVTQSINATIDQAQINWLPAGETAYIFTSTNLNQAAIAEFEIKSVGNAALENISVAAQSDNLTVMPLAKTRLEPNESMTVKLLIDSAEATAIGEVVKRIKITADDLTDYNYDVVSRVTAADDGSLAAQILCVDQNYLQGGKLILEHQTLSNQKYEIDIASDNQAPIEVDNLAAGDYMATVLYKDKVIAQRRYRVKPSLKTELTMNIPVTEADLSMDFTVTQIKVTETVTHTIITIWEPFTPVYPSMVGEGASHCLTPGQSVNGTLTLKNNSEFAVTGIQISNKDITAADGVEIKLPTIENGTLMPGEEVQVPYQAIATADAKPGTEIHSDFDVVGFGVSGEESALQVSTKLSASLHVAEKCDYEPDKKPFNCSFSGIGGIGYHFEPEKRESNQLTIIAVMSNSRDVFDAKLLLSSGRKDININSVSLVVEDEDGNVATGLSQYNYSGAAYLANYHLPQFETAEIGWYLSNADFAQKQPKNLKVYAVVDYNANGVNHVEKSETSNITVDPLPLVNITYDQFPNAMKQGVNYQAYLLVENVGNGPLKDFNASLSFLKSKECTISASSAGGSATTIAPGGKVAIPMSFSSSKDIQLKSIEWTVDYENSLNIPLVSIYGAPSFNFADEWTKMNNEAWERKNKSWLENMLGDPVDLASGSLFHQEQLLYGDSAHPLDFILYYNSLGRKQSQYGNGWATMLVPKIEIDNTTGAAVDLALVHSSQNRNYFTQSEPGKYTCGDHAGLGVINKTASGYTYQTAEQTINFDQDGLPIEKIYRDGKIVSYAFSDTSLQITEQTTARSLTLNYDENGYIKTVVDQSGRSIALLYDDRHNLIKIVKPDGAVLSYAYDEQNRLTDAWNELSQLRFHNVYNERDMIIAQWDENNIDQPQTIDYSLDGNVVTSVVTDYLGNQKTYTFDIMTANILSVQDSAGYINRYTYDERGLRTSRTNALGNVIYYQYDANGNLIDRQSAEGIHTQTVYDENGNVLESIDGNGNVTKSQYDTNNYLANIDIAGANVTTHYDHLGQLQSVTLADGREITFKTNRGKVTETSVDGQSVKKTYDDMGMLTSLTDENGATTRFEYDIMSRVITITDALGNQTHYQYDAAGRMTTVIDALGNASYLSYDLYGNIIAQTDRIGGVTRFEYDKLQRLVQKTLADGAVHRYVYDQRGNMIEHHQPDGTVLYKTYNAIGKPIKVATSADSYSTFEYDKDNRLIAATRQDGKSVAFEYDANGNMTAMIDALGRRTVTAYDAYNHIVEVVNPAGDVTRINYNQNGQKESVVLADGNQQHYSYTAGKMTGFTNSKDNRYQYSYTPTGLIASAIDPMGNQTRYSYDANGNLLKLTDALGGEITYQYDALGRKISQIDQLGNETRYQYDANDRLTAVYYPLGLSEHYSYDLMGRVISYSPTDQTETHYSYDLMGRLATEKTPTGNTIHYNYNEKGQLSTVSDDVGQLASYQYDANGNMISMRDAAGNTTGYNYRIDDKLASITQPNGAVLSFSYDSRDRLIRTEQGAIQASQGFDSRGRRIFLESPNGDKQHFYYDANGNLIKSESVLATSQKVHNYGYNANDLLISKQDALGRESSYQYDALGRLIAVNEDGAVTHYSYDAVGNVLTISGPNGEIKRSYDALGRVTRYTTSQGQQTEKTISYTYNDNGQLASITYPAVAGASAVTVNYSYDAAGQLATVTDWLMQTTQYSYDLRGRQVTMQRADGSSETRSYTADNRLSGLQDRAAGGQLYVDITLAYDSAGNLISRTSNLSADASGQNTAQYSYAAGDIMTAVDGQAVTSDAEGNITGFKVDGQDYALSYDVRNRLTKIGAVSYRYDSENNKVQMLAGTQSSHYIYETNLGMSRLLVKDDGSANATYYIYGNGLIAEIENDRTYYHHHDAEGNTVLLTDDSGSEVASYRYTPFGETLSSEGRNSILAYGSRYGAITEPNGLIYLRARYYSPQLQRFISQDSYLGEIGSINTLNRYSYNLNNPLRYYDPTGHTANERIFSSGDALAFGQNGNGVMYYANDKPTDRFKQAFDYGLDSLWTAVAGSYAENPTGAGLLATFLVDITPFVGQAADVREICYELTHFNNDICSVVFTTLSVIALIPIVGTVVSKLRTGARTVNRVSDVAKLLDRASEFETLKHLDTIGDSTRNGERLIERFDDLVDATEGFGEVTKHVDDTSNPPKITSLYRAVGPEEFYKIMETGEFGTIPTKMQSKQFGLSFQETLKFTDKFTDLSAIVKVEVPEKALEKIAHHTVTDTRVFKSGVITIDFEKIDEFNSIIIDITHVY